MSCHNPDVSSDVVDALHVSLAHRRRMAKTGRPDDTMTPTSMQRYLFNSRMNACTVMCINFDNNESYFVKIYRDDSLHYLLLDGKLTIHFRWRSLAFLSSLHTFTLIIERIDRVVLIASVMFAVWHSLVIRANERVSGFARE